MAVKLLPKSNIAALKAKEQARTIEEGLKVARRVDALREAYSKTEQELESYRVSTLAAIQEEITNLSEKKDKLQSDVLAMKKEFEGMMPEIPMKRAELDTFEKRLRIWEKKLEKREEKSALAEIDVAEASKKAKDSAIRSEDNERITRNLLLQADRARNEAIASLQNARKTEEKSIIEQRKREEEINLREISIKRRENDCSSMKFNLMQEENKLNKEKARLEDMRNTLQRSLDRIKQGRLA